MNNYHYIIDSSSFFTQMSDCSDFTSDEKELILCQAPCVFYRRSNPMIEMVNKMIKMKFLSKYVIEGLELRLYSYICSHIFIHRTSNIIFTCLLQSRCSHNVAEFTVVHYPTGKHIFFLTCLLCCSVDFLQLSLYLNSTDVN